MKKFKTLDEIEAEKREREKQKFKKEVTEDVGELFSKIFPKKKPKKRWVLLKWLGYTFLLLFMITIILGTAWLLRALVKSLFLGG